MMLFLFLVLTYSRASSRGNTRKASIILNHWA